MLGVSTPEQSYPRLAAATQRFTLGVPGHLRVSPDGARVLYVRSRSGTERTGLLWCYDVAEKRERLLLDPDDVLAGGDEEVPAEERARRERMRQGGAGVTGFAMDAAAERAVVALSGRVFVVDVAGDGLTEVVAPTDAIDPRLSPDGRWVAVHAGGGLHVAPADGSGESQVLVAPEAESVTWGLSDFAHAEELGRMRSFWWSPDSTGLLVARVDEAPVGRWHVADPARPDRPPAVVRYPAAGTDNVETSVWFLDLRGGRAEVPWDRQACPYLVDVSWESGRPALLTVLSRDQRRAEVLAWQPGQVTEPLRVLRDDAWVDVVPGVPAWWGDRLLTVEVDGGCDTFRLFVDGDPATPEGLQVRAVLAVGDGVLVQVAEDDRERRVGRLGLDGGWEWLSEEAAVATAAAGGGTTVVRRDPPERAEPSLTVHRGDGRSALPVHAAAPPWTPRPRRLVPEHPEDPRVAVVEPAGGGPWPVLLDPYGGPHGQRVLDSARAYLDAGWWAEQGYLVVVADGPGTPGRPSWERAMSGRFAEPALAAQVRALEMVAATYGDRADRSRVGVRGWSFGGYLAALLVMERPDLVHAAIAGAPVTEWRLYDTAYTERYLGLPGDAPGRYERESLLPRAALLTRPLLLVHGFADDNVVVAHTLQLSRALLEAGRPHQVLPLSGVTHMTPQEVVAENLLLLQRDFLADALG